MHSLELCYELKFRSVRAGVEKLGISSKQTKQDFAFAEKKSNENSYGTAYLNI